MIETAATIQELYQQWKITRANLELDILETWCEDSRDDLMGAALEQYRAIELAILSTGPDSIQDADLVALLDLARELIRSDDEYALEQKDRGHQMLDLLRLTLTRRWSAGWLQRLPDGTCMEGTDRI